MNGGSEPNQPQPGHGKSIGLIGAGAWGRNILRDLRLLGCDVHVMDRSGASTDAAIALGATSVVQNISDVPTVDGLIVATPSTSHAEVIHSVLDRNVPIFVEKPMTTRWSDAQLLIERGAERIFVMDKWRYHPGVLALAELARGGTLGSVVGLRTARLSTGNPHDDTDPTWILAPHDLSIAIEILGEIPTPMYAVADRDTEGVAGFSALLGTRPWLSVEVSGRSDCHSREVRLYCSDGIAILGDAYSDHLAIVRGRGSGQTQQRDEERHEVSGEMPLLAELRAFVSYLEGGPPPKSSARDGARVVEVISQIRVLAGIDAVDA